MDHHNVITTFIHLFMLTHINNMHGLQRCLLPPPLFNIAIKHSVIWFRSHYRFEDNYLSRPDPHLSLVLGDHLLYISHQISSQILLILDQFGCLLSKHNYFCNPTRKTLLYSTIPFEIL